MTTRQERVTARERCIRALRASINAELEAGQREVAHLVLDEVLGINDNLDRIATALESIAKKV